MRVIFIALMELVMVLGVGTHTQTPPEGRFEALESPVSAFSIKEDVVTTPETETVSETTRMVDIAPITYYDVELDEDLQDHIFLICKEYGVDPAIVIAMIWRESNFNPDCVGDNGNSFGLMQIQPRFHSDRMDECGCIDLLDPYQNVLVGVDYLAEMLGKGKGIEWALMAYNGGPAYANRKLEAGEVSKYAASVLEKSRSMETYERYLEVE